MMVTSTTAEAHFTGFVGLHSGRLLPGVVLPGLSQYPDKKYHSRHGTLRIISAQVGAQRAPGTNRLERDEMMHRVVLTLLLMMFAGKASAVALSEDNFGNLCLGSSMAPVGNVAGAPYVIQGSASGFPYTIIAERVYCPVNSDQVYIRFRTTPAPGVEGVVRPKITVSVNGRELGWFGGFNFAGSAIALDQDFVWSGCSLTCFYFFGGYGAVIPRRYAAFDAKDQLSFFVEMTGPGIYHGMTAKLDLPAFQETFDGLWWNPAESGSSMTVQRGQSGAIFASWYTFDEQGDPIWFYMSNGKRLPSGVIEGDAYLPTGQPGFEVPYVAARFVPGNPVGRFRIHLSNGLPTQLEYDVQGRRGTKSLQQFVLRDRDGNICRTHNGVWWDPLEPGNAVAVHGALLNQGTGCSALAVWMTFRPDGRAEWVFTGLGGVAGQSVVPVVSYAGPLFKLKGTHFALPFGTMPEQLSTQGSWTSSLQDNVLRLRQVITTPTGERMMHLERFQF